MTCRSLKLNTTPLAADGRPTDLRARCFVGSAHYPPSRVSGRGHPPRSPGRTPPIRSPRPRTLLSCRNPPHCRTSEFSHAPGHRRHHPSRRCRPCRCCPTSCSCSCSCPACRYCSPCYAAAHSADADPTAAASSHPCSNQPRIVTPQTAPTTTPMPVDGQAPTDKDCSYLQRRPARREKSQHRQGRSQARKGTGIPCHPQHHRHRQTRQMGR